MSRDISTGAAAAAVGPHVQYMMFVELVFDGGTVRFCNANRDFNWNALSWFGFGEIGGFGPIDEVSDMSATQLTLSLSGVDVDNIALALAEDCLGRPLRTWLAFVDMDSQAIITDPIGPFRYRMDTMPVELGQTATVSLIAQSRLADLLRARVTRYNDADQQAKYPGDLGLNYTALMVERSLPWGVDG